MFHWQTQKNGLSGTLYAAHPAWQLENYLPTAAERGGNNLIGFTYFCLKAKAWIGPRLAHLLQVRSAAVSVPSAMPGAECQVPRSSELGTYETVKTRLWPWFSRESL